MVNLEAQLKALDIMPELESDDVAQQLALLQADKSTLEKMMHTVGEVKLYLEAAQEADD